MRYIGAKRLVIKLWWNKVGTLFESIIQKTVVLITINFYYACKFITQNKSLTFNSKLT